MSRNFEEVVPSASCLNAIVHRRCGPGGSMFGINSLLFFFIHRGLLFCDSVLDFSLKLLSCEVPFYSFPVSLKLSLTPQSGPTHYAVSSLAILLQLIRLLDGSATNNYKTSRVGTVGAFLKNLKIFFFFF